MDEREDGADGAETSYTPEPDTTTTVWASTLAEHKQKLEAGEIKVTSRSRGEGVIDPREKLAMAPAYNAAHLLPKVFNDYTQNQIATWGGDPGAYAAMFIAMHVGVLHSSVKVQTNPLAKGNWRNPNDFALILGDSGDNKSGMLLDITRFQETWQKALSRVRPRADVGEDGKTVRRPVAQAVMVYLQNASIEGMFDQIEANRGERLMLACEEGMIFYDGAAAHHKDGAAAAMCNSVCLVYDGRMFNKKLRTKLYDIPEALATLIMATVIENISQWKSFPEMVRGGLMARHSVGVISRKLESDPSRLVPGAQEAMADVLLKLRALRNVQFVLEEAAHAPWQAYRLEKEAFNKEMSMFGASDGLAKWSRKYELRIMSMATILQAYDHIGGGGMTAVEKVADDGTDKLGGEVIKTVEITLANLRRAKEFVDGYLYKVQEFFYRVAAGANEFGRELLNFAAGAIVRDDPDNPDSRVVNRNSLTYKDRGPMVCRGDVTPTLKETHKRWIQALLDYGFIAVYEHPRGHESFKRRADNEQPWYQIRGELFEAFASEEDRAWLHGHYAGLQEGLARMMVRRQPSL